MNRPDVWREIEQNDPNSYLSTVGQEASERFLTLMQQFQQSPEIWDLPYMEKVRALLSRRYDADGVVRDELIYQPLPSED